MVLPSSGKTWLRWPSGRGSALAWPCSRGGPALARRRLRTAAPSSGAPSINPTGRVLEMTVPLQLPQILSRRSGDPHHPRPAVSSAARRARRRVTPLLRPDAAERRWRRRARAAARAAIVDLAALQGAGFDFAFDPGAVTMHLRADDRAEGRGQYQHPCAAATERQAQMPPNPPNWPAISICAPAVDYIGSSPSGDEGLKAPRLDLEGAARWQASSSKRRARSSRTMPRCSAEERQRLQAARHPDRPRLRGRGGARQRRRRLPGGTSCSRRRICSASAARTLLFETAAGPQYPPHQPALLPPGAPVQRRYPRQRRSASAGCASIPATTISATCRSAPAQRRGAGDRGRCRHAETAGILAVLSTARCCRPGSPNGPSRRAC